MKTNILTTLVISLLSLCAFSQQKNITGPKAENSHRKKLDYDTYKFIPLERTIVTGSKLKSPQFYNSNPRK
ncbi:hypothetical protein C8P64_1542 [Christiangramia gaetbulicola]|uniref:Uncharacterized protein n=1 Tax=Christiangramia gaetbulicola TaxID=703340 RepID=A0A2T6AGR4_9FLAO|nr:hypothetical protein C8P64_1542 [Christiangramia gaetbulicola]